MKTKIAFLAGGVLGYILGTRAGRKRYEQIKSGALKVWNSGPVQKQVGAAQNFAQDRTNAALAAMFDAGKNFFSKTETAQTAQPARPAKAATDSAAEAASEASDVAEQSKKAEPSKKSAKTDAAAKPKKRGGGA